MQKIKPDPVLADLANTCVSCGLCVPVCPTWQANHNEADSPRGRITLMRQLADGTLPDDISHYLDACLGCGRCEQICPSKVPYMEMLTYAKGKVVIPKNLSTRIVNWLVQESPTAQYVRSLALSAARLARICKLQHLLPRRLRAIVAAVPIAQPSLRLTSAPSNDKTKHVELFVDCLGKDLDRATLLAAVKLLRACDYEVSIPKNQGCCGAIAQHSGDVGHAAKCAVSNQNSFAATGYIGITATGCAPQLQATFGERVVNVGELIARRINRLQFKLAAGVDVLVHTPCSQRSMHGTDAWVKTLLNCIHGLSVLDAADNIDCCGAGGLTHINHVNTGEILAKRKLKYLAARKKWATIWVTTNYSCGWHMSVAAHTANQRLIVSSPLALAASYLDQRSH